jgi:hypothetical protein
VQLLQRDEPADLFTGQVQTFRSRLRQAVTTSNGRVAVGVFIGSRYKRGVESQFIARRWHAPSQCASTASR